MSNFIKIFPKTIAIQNNEAAGVIATMTYMVEQYGLFTGPFHIVVRFHRASSGTDLWQIIEHINEQDSDKDTDDQLFEHFFPSLQYYLRLQLGADPIDQIKWGQMAHFEFFFPEIHFDMLTKNFLPNDTSPPD
jgi:hypothetical protein